MTLNGKVVPPEVVEAASHATAEEVAGCLAMAALEGFGPNEVIPNAVTLFGAARTREALTLMGMPESILALAREPA